MRKTFFTYFVICLFSSTAFSQSNDELQSINNKSKQQFIRPEVLDMLMINLRKFEVNSNRNQDTLLLETYLSIGTAYMANNHFKQACEVYYKYIHRKEEMLTADKSASIRNAVNRVKGLEQSDESKESQLQNQLLTLKQDNDRLTTKQLSFKRNFSFALIFLSAIFAVLLFSAGIRLMNIRSTLQQNREKMKKIHRLSVIGRLSKGLIVSLKDSIERILNSSKEISQSIRQQDAGMPQVKQATQTLSSFEKNLHSVTEKLK